MSFFFFVQSHAIHRGPNLHQYSDCTCNIIIVYANVDFCSGTEFQNRFHGCIQSIRILYCWFYFANLFSSSAAILPDSGASYRFGHDVSFDEGSRYRTTDLNNGFKANMSDHGLNGLSRQFTSAIAMRHNENG